ncbi:MAG TPA: hypothetical protein VMF14_02880 [Solirubrobacteraceae bacterium]|nr:hypothetical protein [Solirubrobacteraceae bacterium]
MSEPDHSSSLSSALDPAALRAALVPQRPVFANPWDSTQDMFACYFAVAFFDPLLLWLGGKIMGAIFGFGTHWPLGVFLLAALVGAGGFMTIVGRQRTSLSVDVVAISGWIVLGLIVAPIVGLAPPALVAVIIYAVMLAAIFGYVLLLGRWEKAFIKTLTWPVTWSLLAIGFAFTAYRLILFQ